MCIAILDLKKYLVTTSLYVDWVNIFSKFNLFCSIWLFDNQENEFICQFENIRVSHECPNGCPQCPPPSILGLRCRRSEWEKMSFFALNIQNGVKSKNFEDFIFQIFFPAQAAFFGFLWLFFRIQSCKYGETYLKKVFVVFSTKMKSFRKKYFFRKFLPRGQDIQVLILAFLHRFQKLIS